MGKTGRKEGLGEKAESEFCGCDTLAISLANLANENVKEAVGYTSEEDKLGLERT